MICALRRDTAMTDCREGVSWKGDLSRANGEAGRERCVGEEEIEHRNHETWRAEA